MLQDYRRALAAYANQKREPASKKPSREDLVRDAEQTRHAIEQLEASCQQSAPNHVQRQSETLTAGAIRCSRYFTGLEYAQYIYLAARALATQVLRPGEIQARNNSAVRALFFCDFLARYEHTDAALRADSSRLRDHIREVLSA